MPQHFQITLATRQASVDLISTLRRTLHQSVAALRQKIVAGAPIIDENPHHNAYDEFIDSVTTLLRDLDGLNLGYAIVIDDRPETADYLRNIFAHWYRIREEIQEQDDRIAQADGDG